MGTTMWALFPASEHMARRVSSFVLGSSCMLSRSMMPSTTSSIYRVEPEESQSFLLCFLPSSSLSTNYSNSRGLVAILSVTVQAECWRADQQGPQKEILEASARPTIAPKSRQELPGYLGDTRCSRRRTKTLETFQGFPSQLRSTPNP